jgi:ubiquinone/menaquinone biosynthesis C-methylase UbiE
LGTNALIDIIVNVEASHAYNDEGVFFAECYRILAPGGYMCWTDFRPHPFYDTRVFEKAKEARLQVHELSAAKIYNTLYAVVDQP